MTTGGKGSRQRPTDHAKFSANYDLIFNKKETPCPKKTTTVLRAMEQVKEEVITQAVVSVGAQV
jgi:hypothetical protein